MLTAVLLVICLVMLTGCQGQKQGDLRLRRQGDGKHR